MDYIEGWYETHPALEYDRRGLSGVYIFDRYPEEEKVEPTCFEDCTPMKQEEYIKALPEDALQKLALMLARALKDVGADLNIESEPYSGEKLSEKSTEDEETDEIPQG